MCWCSTLLKHEQQGQKQNCHQRVKRLHTCTILHIASSNIQTATIIPIWGYVYMYSFKNLEQNCGSVIHYWHHSSWQTRNLGPNFHRSSKLDRFRETFKSLSALQCTPAWNRGTIPINLLRNELRLSFKSKRTQIWHYRWKMLAKHGNNHCWSALYLKTHH